MEISYDSNGYRYKAEMFRAELVSATQDALKKFGLRIIANAKTRLKNYGSVVTGNLRASGQIKAQQDNTIDAGFYSDYAAAVEYGRKSGKMPPVAMIAAWVKKKHLASDPKEINSIAWGIAQDIAKNGTEARPFLYPAFEEESHKMEFEIGRRISRVTEKNYDND